MKLCFSHHTRFTIDLRFTVHFWIQRRVYRNVNFTCRLLPIYTVYECFMKEAHCTQNTFIVWTQKVSKWWQKVYISSTILLSVMTCSLPFTAIGHRSTVLYLVMCVVLHVSFSNTVKGFDLRVIITAMFEGTSITPHLLSKTIEHYALYFQSTYPV